MIEHLNPHRHVTIHRVHRARKTRIISPHDHFNRVFDLLVDFAVFDVTLGHVFDALVHAAVVAYGADDEVDFSEDAVGVGGVVVDEGAAGSFDDADALAAFDGEFAGDVGVGDVGVVEELVGFFDGVEDFGEAGPVVEEGVVPGFVEFGFDGVVFFAGEGGAHVVGNVDAAEGADAVDAFGPAPGAVEGEFEVGVVGDVFTYVFEVVFDGEFSEFFAGGVDHAKVALVDFQFAFGSDQTEVAGLEFVEEFDFVEEGADDGQEFGGEGLGFVDLFQEVVTFFFEKWLGYAAGLCCDGMDGTSAGGFDEVLADLAEADDFADEVGIFFEKRDNMAFFGTCIR